MSSFSRVISRPTHKDQFKPFKPTFATTQAGRGIWQPTSVEKAALFLYQPVVSNSLHTLFDPIWNQNFNGDSLLQRQKRLAGKEIASPPSTACSSTAVLGTPDMDGAFKDDYDRPEADPDFVRKMLRGSKLLRRQARMRDGDYRDSDEENDYSVTDEWIPVVRPEIRKRHPPSQRVPLRQLAYDSLPIINPSRLSRRVKVPAPIDTTGPQVAIAARVLREKHEHATVNGSDPMFISATASDGDDERDSLRRETQTPEDAIEAVCIPDDYKGSYAVIVSSPSCESAPPSHMEPQAIHLMPTFEDVTFRWLPFVEPLES